MRKVFRIAFFLVIKIYMLYVHGNCNRFWMQKMPFHSLSLSWHYKHALSCRTHIGGTRVLWTFRINFWKTQHWIVCMACSCRVDGLSQVHKNQWLNESQPNRIHHSLEKCYNSKMEKIKNENERKQNEKKNITLSIPTWFVELYAKMFFVKLFSVSFLFCLAEIVFRRVAVVIFIYYCYNTISLLGFIFLARSLSRSVSLGSFYVYYFLLKKILVYQKRHMECDNAFN